MERTKPDNYSEEEKVQRRIYSARFNNYYGIPFKSIHNVYDLQSSENLRPFTRFLFECKQISLELEEEFRKRVEELAKKSHQLKKLESYGRKEADITDSSKIDTIPRRKPVKTKPEKPSRPKLTSTYQGL